MKPTFGSRLRQERLRLGLTQGQLAELGGVSRTSQHLYEQDARVPDVNYLLNVQRSHVDVGSLILDNADVPPGGMQGRSLLPPLIAAFRAVEESSRDENGELLPYQERERFFRFLCSTLLSQDDVHGTLELKARLMNSMRT